MKAKLLNEVVIKKCNIFYEWRIKVFHLTKDTLNFALTADLLPFIDKYLAEIAKRDRSSEYKSPVEAPERKVSRQEPSAYEERKALATELFCASVDDAELEVLQNLLTAEIEKRKKPPSSIFVDIRKLGSSPPTCGICWRGGLIVWVNNFNISKTIS